MIKLNIDGVNLEAKSGLTILEIAKSNNIYIPTLCHMPKRDTRSVCRICIVEIEGLRGLHTACSVEAKDGMVVQTNNEHVNSTRKTLMEFVMAEHPVFGKTDKKIKELAKYLNVDKPRFSIPEKDVSRFEAISSEYIKLDMSKCVHCDRCVRSCDYRKVITRKGFGIYVSMAFDDDVSIEQSNCVQCGDCIQACPSGAISRA